MELLTNQRRAMSRIDAMHVDHLVVWGGASLTSPVRWKATSRTITNHHPGTWAYLGMTFLLLTFMSCQPVLGIEGDIFPENDIIEVGTNLNITCILRNENGADMGVPTSEAIVWYKDTHVIPSDEYHIVNDTASSISIVNATLMDSATYYCALNRDIDISDCLSSALQVGYKPQPVSFLACASHNVIDYYCEWDTVPTHIVNESHIFEYWYQRRWTKCPDYSSPNKCLIIQDHHMGFTQRVRVVSSNDLGDNAIKVAYFNPDTETIPHPPRSLTLISKSFTELAASWQLPPEWPTSYYQQLRYRLRWALQRYPRAWLGELRCSSLSCDIGQLEPYTEYEVEVACMYTFNRRNAWGNWSDPVEGRTDQAAPIGTVQDLQTSDLNGTSDYDRNVLISWETVPEQEQRGPILGYSITVTPYSSCLEHQIINDTVNRTKVIVEGLEKFCSYTVRITAFNSVGSGPVEDTKIQDMTTNPLPPSVVEAETLSHESVLVTWNKPTPVQGYISHYTVHWIQARGQDLGRSRQVNASKVSYRVDGLEGYVLYSFKVSVTNRIGDGGWSKAVQTTTKEWIPEASPTDVTVEPITNSLLVNWIDVSEEDAHGQIQGHHLYYCRVAEESLSVPLCSLFVSDCLENQERRKLLKTSHKPVTLTGLAPFSHYLIWSSAFTSVGEGPRSDCPSSGRTSEGTPSPPLNVSVTWSNSTSIGLIWSPPMEKNGIIRNYTVLVKSNTSTEQQEFYTGGVQSYLVEGRHGYIHYTIQVRACTTVCGDASAEVYQQTDIGVPEQPGNLNIQPMSHNLVTLSWDPPVHPNGPIDHYLVSYRHAEEPPTPSPAVNHVRSVSTTTTLANSIEEWLKTTTTTTELTMKMEVDCSQAPFLFQVVAVNVLEGSPSVGEAAESVLSECIALETTLSPLIWLILPGGAILLFALLTSLYYVQSKLGKSWPNPVYPDMVTNKQDIRPRPKRVEKEEFDTIQIGCPTYMSDAIVAEEYPSQPYHCPMQTSNSIIKSEIGGKQEHLRTVSIDSGVPPSPQDQLDFSSSEDVFDLEDHETINDWMQDTYSFNKPKAMVSHTGLGEKGGHLPKRSVSLGNSIGHWDLLPVIEENQIIASTMENIPADKGVISTDRDWLVEDEEDGEAHETAYTFISQLSSLKKQPSFVITDQNSSVVISKVICPAQSGGNCEHMTPNTSNAGHYLKCMKSGVNEVTQKTVFTPRPDNGYVCKRMTSALAVPQVPVGLGQQLVRPLEQSLTSNYVSKEDLTCSKMVMRMVPVLRGNEIIPPSSQPCIQREFIGYVKLGDISPSNKKQTYEGTKKQAESSRNDVARPSPSSCLSDYVRGVDLYKTLKNERMLSESSGSHSGSPICNPGEREKVELTDSQDSTLDGMKAKSVEMGDRSSSGYGSGNLAQISAYVVVSNQPKEKSENYANLAFTSSESETDSDDDVKSEKVGLLEDEQEIGRCVESVSGICDDAGTDSKGKDFESSYVKYMSNDGCGVEFVNDYLRYDPSEDKDSVWFSDSITPCLQTKEQSSCKIIPGYVSHNAVLGADMKGNITPGVERLPSPATPSDTSKPDIYQAPNIVCRELESNRAGHETVEGDDGYVPFSGDDGYVLRVLDQSQTKVEYMPMSPIDKTKMQDCF